MDDKRIEALFPADSWDKEIEGILSFVKRGQSVQLVGIPGTGRSDILGLLSYNRNVRIKHLGEMEQVKYHFVLINFSEIKNQSVAEIFKFIFLSLIDSLRLRNILTDQDAKKELETASSIFKSSISTGDDLIIFNALKRTLDFLSIERDLSIIFLFDRFEDYIPFATHEFFLNLRALRNRAKFKFSVVFSLRRPIEDTLEEEIYKDFGEFLEGNLIYLPISDESSLRFKIEHFGKISGKKLDQKTIQDVLRITAGHSRLTRLCLQEPRIYDLGFKIDDLLSNDKIKKALFDIWNSLTPEEYAFLKSLQGETPKHLINVGLLVNKKISIPLFAEFVKQVEPKKEKFFYDTQTKEIKKGNTIFSNSLTALEFKLFKTLLEHEGQIIPRDEMVSSVWSDLKSTEGITDQAIDQLTFRLRKKIEKDPSHPKFIQTIKGRGITFSQ